MTNAKHSCDGYHWNTCPDCGKKSYRTRKAARKMRRVYHPGDRQSAYECPYGNGWHYGHTPTYGRRGAA